MFYLVGPTASGKSAVAVELARRIDGEVVNADAFQLYAGLPITTAQPSADEQAAVPHHLYGILPLTEKMDAQRYRDLAMPVIQDVLSRGRWPVITGGSGLYLKSLTHGLAPLPPIDGKVRAELAAMTAAERVRRLLELDPAAAGNVPLSNDRYVSRALEVCLVTGEPQSALRAAWQTETPEGKGVVIQRERADILQRISQRTAQMLAQGLVEEIRGVNEELGDHAAAKAIGVAQVRAHLAGEMNVTELAESIGVASRQYAKRQMTWFRREKYFQTICPRSDSPVYSVVDDIIAQFPCLAQPPPSGPSS